ncbi:MAG: histidine phosphatase family protein [Planctomycetes bacterium]|nr:histidine phosphatase family protein [Planctomycetota bacterium]
MRRLSLIRHAKSDWSNAARGDRDRSLNDRGRRDAPEMGRRLKRRGLSFELTLASDACRAQETIELIRAELKEDAGRLQVEPALYLASAEDVLAMITGQDDRITDLAVVGHNPGMTSLALALGAEIENIPTCGIVTFAYENLGSWSELGQVKPVVIEVDLPKLPLKD